MRKVRDYDAELKALGDKARALKARKIEQLGALVVATGADALDLEVIAGMLRHGVMEAKVSAVKESWRAEGATFLKSRGRKGHGAAGGDKSGTGAQRDSEAAG
ncbi:MAG: conjugal transfer protein TraD [Croceibacterium sp.]